MRQKRFPLRRPLGAAAAALSLLAAACGAPSAPPAGPAPPEAQPLVVMIGVDALRWDFPERAATPHLDRLAAAGVRAERLIPAFPTKTFPNFYTLATGIYPGRHGVVANNMYDPVFDAIYGLGLRDEVANARWYGGEPVWVTAQRAGLRTAPLLWPGSEAAIGGLRPTFWRPYEQDWPNEERVDWLLERLALPAGERPHLATVYFSTVDDVAHRRDPESDPEVAAAVAHVDAAIGRLLDGLERLGLLETAHLLVVSDHGMATTSPERVVLLDDYVDLATANVVDWNPVAALWPTESKHDEVYAALAGAHPHLRVYRRGEIPEAYHFREHRRVPPILAVADEGWSVSSRAYFEAHRDAFFGGNHGYDPRLRSMGATFIAAGPRLARGATVEPFESVHVYPLLCHLLGVEPAPADGRLEAVRHLLGP